MAIADDRAKAVELALSQIEKQFGKGSIVRLGSREALLPIAVISTGSISFDAALGVGGIPRGRVTEIYGPESSGKTTITLQIIAEAQRAGGLAEVHRDHDAQVVVDAHDAVEDADGDQPVELGRLHGGPEQIELTEEATRRRDTAQRQQEDRHRQRHRRALGPEAGPVVDEEALVGK